MERPPHRAILFDLFDTLCRIDETIYLAGKAEEARLLGFDPESFLGAWIALGDQAQTGVLSDIPARVRAAAVALGRVPEASLIARVARVEVDSLTAGTTLYPDVLPTLRAVSGRDGLKVGLVSNASSTATILFERLALGAYFDATVFSFQVGVVKPQPAIYLRACGDLRVPPGSCLFVGDGNARELDGAKAVGMEAVRIERPVSLGPYRKEESLHFDFSVGDLTHVVSLLRS